MFGWRSRPIMASLRCRSLRRLCGCPRPISIRRRWCEQVNSLLSKKYNKTGDYVLAVDYPDAWLNEEAFAAAGRKEPDAPRRRGRSACNRLGWPDTSPNRIVWHARDRFRTRKLGRRYAAQLFSRGRMVCDGRAEDVSGRNNGMAQITRRRFRTILMCRSRFMAWRFSREFIARMLSPTDLAVTLASLLGINAPAQATGRVLTEALAHIEVQTDGSFSGRLPARPRPRSAQ
jgi:hypothetical protein